MKRAVLALCLQVGCAGAELPRQPGPDAATVIVNLDAGTPDARPTIGGPCTKPYACDGDKAGLECKSGKWEGPIPCRGLFGCVAEPLGGTTVLCQSGGCEVGDRCFDFQEGGYDCTTDRKALCRCAGGRLILARQCTSCTNEQIDGGSFVVCR